MYCAVCRITQFYSSCCCRWFVAATASASFCAFWMRETIIASATFAELCIDVLCMKTWARFIVVNYKIINFENFKTIFLSLDPMIFGLWFVYVCVCKMLLCAIEYGFLWLSFCLWISISLTLTRSFVLHSGKRMSVTIRSRAIIPIIHIFTQDQWQKLNNTKKQRERSEHNNLHIQ